MEDAADFLLLVPFCDDLDAREEELFPLFLPEELFFFVVDFLVDVFWDEVLVFFFAAANGSPLCFPGLAPGLFALIVLVYHFFSFLSHIS